MNLSAKIPSEDQISVMSLGLTFAPTKHFDLFGTIIDVNKFVRHLIVKKHFFNNEMNTYDNDIAGINTTIDANVEISEPVSEGLNLVPTTFVVFSEQCALSALQHLQAESGMCDVDSGVSDFVCRNSNFYPIHSRSLGVNQFQAPVERDLIKLKQNQKTDFHHSGYNLSNKQRLALKQLSILDDVVIRKADKGGAVTVLDKGLYLMENKRMLEDLVTYVPIGFNLTDR